MAQADDYLEKNKALWNAWTKDHLVSEFYDVQSFVKGRNSLTDIERDLLGDVKGASVLHLQCHFGQETISMARLGAHATGIDLSDQAISEAKKLNEKVGTNATFIASDVYSLPTVLDDTFDIVFTSFGTIGWLPDVRKWANVVKHFTRPGGRFIMAEFHPVVWMFDNDLKEVIYPYFHGQAIVENETGSYASTSEEESQSITWNHALSEVFTALIDEGFTLQRFEEFDYSPHNCFRHTEEFEPGKFRIKHFENRVPLVYAIEATLP